MNRCPLLALWCLLSSLLPLKAQTTIFWGTGSVGQSNLTSAGLPMDAGFQFELGVFANNFVPTEANLADWATNWRRFGDRLPYSTSLSSVSGSNTVTSNVTPFNVGRKAYIWGFRGSPLAGEWILFSAPGWSWPSGSASPPGFAQWWAVNATTPIFGEVNTSGSPFLMKSAAVVNVSPPATSWSQWQQQMLAGNPLNGPNDDPDSDGTPNLLEFAFGSVPTVATPPPATPVSVESGYLVITIPRRSDHTVNLTVEVSSDLGQWDSGPTVTEVLSSTPAALVVRDRTPIGPANPTRHIRVRATLPPQ